MSAILVKMPPATRCCRSQRFTDRKTDEARPARFPRHEKQDEQHHDQFDRYEQHADAHPRLQRNVVTSDTVFALELPANAVRLLAKVLTRIPNAATAC